MKFLLLNIFILIFTAPCLKAESFGGESQVAGNVESYIKQYQCDFPIRFQGKLRHVNDYKLMDKISDQMFEGLKKSCEEKGVEANSKVLLRTCINGCFENFKNSKDEITKPNRVMSNEEQSCRNSCLNYLVMWHEVEEAIRYTHEQTVQASKLTTSDCSKGVNDSSISTGKKLESPVSSDVPAGSGVKK